jgi:hypothetical protein
LIEKPAVSKEHGMSDVLPFAEVLEAADHLSEAEQEELIAILNRRLACSAGFDLRIVFQFVEYQGADAILLQTVGTHDAVY